MSTAQRSTSLLVPLLGAAVLASAVLVAVWALGSETAPAASESVAPETGVAAREPAAASGVLPPRVAESQRPLSGSQPLPTNEVERQLQLLAYDIDAERRLAAAEALAEWVPGAAEAGLARAAADDRSAPVREAALRALEGALATDLVPLYAAALSDPDLWVQDAGETGLYRHDDREGSRNALARLCMSDVRDVRLRAAELLDEMEAGELPWDELYAGPTGLAWAPPPPTPNEDTDDH